MPWVRLDDRFPSHRKVALLSDKAFRLYVSSLCWAAENLTEGRIAARELPLVAGRIRSPKTAAAELQTAGLWDAIADGWTIHDFLEYNRDRATVKEERAANAARQAAYRERKKAARNGAGNAPRNGVTPEPDDADGDTTATRREHDGDTTATRSDAANHEKPQASEVRNAVTNAAPSPTRPTTYYVGSENTSTIAPRSADTQPVRDDVERLCTHLADRIEANGSKRPTIGQTWRTAARLLLDRDGRTEDQVHAAIDWCQADPFWRSNVLSMPTLRKQYDRLRLAAARPAGGNVVPIAAARTSTTDQRVSEGMALAARLRAQEAAQ
ncbi:hypothetical protein PV318_03155 [Streptomyces sp. ME02-6991-2B]|nr:hypothetical protein [Streptomyces sp. ME02-6991-2B]